MSYQRPIDEDKLQHLIDNFDPEKLTVAQMQVDGEGRIVNGWHRFYAALLGRFKTEPPPPSNGR